MRSTTRPILLAAANKFDVSFFKRAYETTQLSNPLQVVSDGTALAAYLKGEAGFVDRVKYPYPVLVLLDFRLPGKESKTLFGTGNGLPAIPIIAFSSIADLKEMSAAYRDHAASFLIKPITARELLETMRCIQSLKFQTDEGGFVIVPALDDAQS